MPASTKERYITHDGPFQQTLHSVGLLAQKHSGSSPVQAVTEASYTHVHVLKKFIARAQI